MFIVMERRTAGVLFFGIFFLGIGLGFYNFALHPNMFNWEKEGILIREVRTDQKVSALTFDDGPDPVNTKALLEVLEKYKIQATFFVLGKRAEKHPELLKKMVEAGHEIANHSYSHADFNGKSDEFILEEIKKTNAIIKSVTGQNPVFFRPPGGYLSHAMIDLAQEHNLTIGYWTWQQDSKDWRDGMTGERIAKHILNHLYPGQIVVLHDGASNGMETAKAMDILIPQLKKNGYKCVTLSHLLNHENHE
jgi:peptidoglycan/xylan/chitin deacetylase (PgdA/CDA1 family)